MQTVIRTRNTSWGAAASNEPIDQSFNQPIKPIKQVPIKYNTIQNNTIQYSAIQYKTNRDQFPIHLTHPALCVALCRRSALLCGTLWRSGVLCGALGRSGALCGALRCSAALGGALGRCMALRGAPQRSVVLRGDSRSSAELCCVLGALRSLCQNPNGVPYTSCLRKFCPS